MRIRIQPSAKRDIRRGYRFYEGVERGVGAYFFDSINANIDSLVLYAGIHQKRGSLYRFCTRPFPFWIYYRIDNGVCYVVAVLDARQDPDQIERREQVERNRLGGPSNG